MPQLEMKNVFKGFGKAENRTEVLRDINLSVQSGEFVAIVGYSGKADRRFGLPAPSIRSLPAFTCGIEEAGPLNMIWSWPPSRSVIAGATPLYGT